MTSTYPRNQGERDSTLQLLLATLDQPGADPETVQLDARLLKAPRETYRSSLENLNQARMEASVAEARYRRSRQTLTVAMREWFASVRDERGRAMSTDLARLVGLTQVSGIHKLSRKEHTRCCKLLFACVDPHLELQGNVVLYLSAKARFNDLAALAETAEAAQMTALSLSSIHKKATHDYSKAYSSFVHALLALKGDDETCRILPWIEKT